jgi:hypothetical protein
VKPVVIVAIHLALLLAGCGPLTPTPRAQTPPATKHVRSTRTPTRTRAPSPLLSVSEVVLYPQPARAEVSVYGLVENLGTDPLSDVEILVQLLDESDTLLQQRVAPIFLPHLHPQDESPFAVNFSDAADVAHVRVELASYTKMPVTSVPLTLDAWSQTSEVGGRTAVLGELENDSDRTVVLHRIGFAVLSADGELQGLSPPAAHLSLLEPGEVTPFITTLDELQTEQQLEPYIDAAATTIKKYPPDLSLQSVWLDRTSQRAPFLLGEISNEGYTATWARLMTSFRYDGRLIAVVPIDLPFPIPADEQWPFGVMHIPGLEAALEEEKIELERVEIEVLIDPYAQSEARGDVQMLQIQVSHYEPIGSTLLIRGSVINGTENEVVAPTVYAALRTTQGDLITVGWSKLEDGLDSQESAPFTVNLPLPQNADVPMSEHDILAVGFLTDDS